MKSARNVSAKTVWHLELHFENGDVLPVAENFPSHSEASEAGEQCEELLEGKYGRVVTEIRVRRIEVGAEEVNAREVGQTKVAKGDDLECSQESYMRTIHCADVLVGDVIKQEPNGTIVCAMRPALSFEGEAVQPGDRVLIDPARTPQAGDWVYVGEGPGFLGMPGIGGDRFKEYPCQEKVLGVIVAHFPAA